MKFNDNNTPTMGKSNKSFYYDLVGIEAANLSNVYAQFASKRYMPTKHGKEFRVSRWEHIFDRKLADPEFAKYGFLSSRSVADVTASIGNAVLAEGAGRVNIVDFAKTTITTTCKRYGEMIDYTDEVELFFEDEMQARYRQELGMLANRRHEDLLQIDMLGTTNVLYAATGTSKATMGTGILPNGSLDDQWKVNYNLIRNAVRKLKRNRAEKHTQLVSGSLKIDTRTCNSAYYAIIGPEVKYDLETTTRGKGNVEEFIFIPVEKYANASNLAEGEVGQLHDVRFVQSESALVYRNEGAAVPSAYAGELSYTGTPGNGKFDVFPILFPTKDAFATVGLKGMDKVKFHAQSPEQAVNRENPYATNGFMSYNFWYASIILQPEKLLVTYVLASR